MREIRIFELDGRQTVSWYIDTASETTQTLQVLQGLLWITVDNHPTDFWLKAGDSLDLLPGQQAWLGTWTDGARFRISQPLESHQPRRIALRGFRLSRLQAGAWQGWRWGRTQ